MSAIDNRNLVRLYLDHNRLLQVPSELASLTHLQWLQLNNNKITSSGIHADLLSLPSLVGIDNQITFMFRNRFWPSG